jgi:hypothetical protein
MRPMPPFTALPPWLLASAVTSLAMLGAGFGTLAMARLTRSQPAHWTLAYAAAALVGVTTVGLHALGEPEGGLRLRAWSFADTAANLLLALAIVRAALLDFGPPATQHRNLAIALVLNAFAIGHVFVEKFLGGGASGVAFASFGALSASQLALVADYAAVIALMSRARASLPERSRRLLPLLGLLSLLGLALAIPDGDQMLAGVFAWHAIWHLVGAFLLLLLWIVNELRFGGAPLARGSAR